MGCLLRQHAQLGNCALMIYEAHYVCMELSSVFVDADPSVQV